MILRGPCGCPWDREQELADLRAYLLEEAHETAAAIDSGDPDELSTELGDLLFLIVFAVRLCEEIGVFDMTQVVQRVHQKMIQRHPHVFGEETAPDSSSVRKSWEARKLAHRERSILSDVPASLPTLLAAYRMTQKASGLGFDWPDVKSIVAKIDEELAELQAEISHTEGNIDKGNVREEVGDLLFTVANLARRLEIDPEAALASANRKFKRRFQSMEEKVLQRGGGFGNSTLDELDEIWSEVKREES